MTEQKAMEWLRSRLDSTDTIRLGVRESGERISPKELSESFVEADEDKRYTFVLEEESQTRHEVSISGDSLDHERRLRNVFILDEDDPQDSDIEFILEVSKSDGKHWIEDEFTVDRETLGDIFGEPSVTSISAGRVAGLDEQKERLRRFLNTDNTDWGMSNRAGVLLEGPPGTGKTELVIETCEELFGGLPVTISGPEILSKWVGESERLLRKQFEEARESRANVLYIDEIDAIARSRSETTHEHSAQLVAQLLVLLDGVDSKQEDSLKVIASTNLAEVIDPALLRPGRLGNQPIEFQKPDVTQRMAIFYHYIEKIRRSESGELGKGLKVAIRTPEASTFLEDIAEETEGYTGADIEDVIIAAVTQLRSEDGWNKDRLEKSRIHDIVRNREVQSGGPSYTETEVTSPNFGDSISPENERQVIRLTESHSSDDIESLAGRWSAGFEDTEFVLRTVETSELVGSGVEDTRDRVISAFQPESDSGLCLHLADFSSVGRASDETPIAKVLVETVHEELMRWDERNLLIYEDDLGEDGGIEAEHIDASV